MQLKDLVDLDRHWDTNNEDNRRWRLTKAVPSSEAVEFARRAQLAGCLPQLKLYCDGTLLFSLGAGHILDTEPAVDYWQSKLPHQSDFLIKLTVEIAEVIYHQRSELLGLKVHMLCQHLHNIGRLPLVEIEVDKVKFAGLFDVYGYPVSVWASELHYFNWLGHLPLNEALSALARVEIALFPVVNDGAPAWFAVPAMLGDNGYMERLRDFRSNLQQRMLERERQLSARSHGGTILVPALFDQINSAWLASAPFLGPLAGATILASLSSDYVAGLELVVELRSADNDTTTHITIEPDRLKDRDRHVVLINETLAVQWLEFLRFYEAAREEASRHVKIWTTALGALQYPNAVSLLNDLAQVTARYRAIRNKLLDENLDKGLTAVEKAQTIVNQLTNQLTRDVDSIGSDVEKLAVASITSGVVGISAAIFKSDGIAVIGPLATALVFLWYFPLVFSRLDYLAGSLQRRSEDLRNSIAALKRASGDIIGLESYVGQLDPHNTAASNALIKFHNHLVSILVVLHFIACSISGWVIWVHGLDVTALTGLLSIVLYSVAVIVMGLIPKKHRGLLTVVFVCCTLIPVIVGCVRPVMAHGGTLGGDVHRG